MAMKRIIVETKNLADDRDFVEAFFIEPATIDTFDEMGNIGHEYDYFRWKGYINGIEGTPYNGGRFGIDIRIPTDYPQMPPQIRFTTKIFHPNISDKGEPCISILKPKPNGEWSPSWTLGKTLLALRSMLANPNPNDPLDQSASTLYIKDINMFNQKAMEMTKRYASY